MNKFLALLALMIAAFVPTQVQARERYFNYCQEGNQPAFVANIRIDTPLQRTFPGCTVQVVFSGTSTPATIYADVTGTPLANPFTADMTTGYFEFYGDNGTYDLLFSGGDITTPYSWPGVSLIDPANVPFIINYVYPAAGGDILANQCAAAAAVNATLVFSAPVLSIPNTTCASKIAFVSNGILKTANGATFNETNTISAPCGAQIFDYSAGGSFTIAFPSNSCPQWVGVKGDGSTNDTPAFANYVTLVGNAGVVRVPQRATCYKTHIVLNNGQTLQGDGAVSRGASGIGSELCNDGTSSPMVSVATGAQKVHVKDLTIDCGAVANIGVFLDGGTGNLTNSSVEENDIQSCNTSQISLHNTYSVRVISNRLTGTGSYLYAIDMQAGGVNGQAYFEGNIMDGAQTACFHMMSGVGPVDTLTMVNNTIQSCAGDGFQVDGNLLNLTMTGNHLENNGIKGSGGPYYSVNFLPQGAATLSYNARIQGNWFLNSGGISQAANFNSLGGLEFSNNTGTLVPSNTKNIIVLGGSVLDPKIHDNFSIATVNGSGTAVLTSDAIPVWENLFRNSVLMTSTWNVSTGTLSQDGTLGPDGLTKAWKFAASGGAVQFSNGITTTNGGHVFGCAGWARTDAGTATLLLDIAATSNYVPLTDYVDTSWRYLSHIVSMPSSDAAGSASCVFKGVVTSGASAFYFINGQFTEDSLIPLHYVPTTSNTVSRAISGIGRTTFAQLPSGTGVQNLGPIWVDDSNTVVWGANVAGGGSGTPALAANNGSNWTVIGK